MSETMDEFLKRMEREHGPITRCCCMGPQNGEPCCPCEMRQRERRTEQQNQPEPKEPA